MDQQGIFIKEHSFSFFEANSMFFLVNFGLRLVPLELICAHTLQYNYIVVYGKVLKNATAAASQTAGLASPTQRSWAVLAVLVKCRFHEPRYPSNVAGLA